jgi:hypothetical protein
LPPPYNAAGVVSSPEVIRGMVASGGAVGHNIRFKPGFSAGPTRRNAADSPAGSEDGPGDSEVGRTLREIRTPVPDTQDILGFRDL